MGDISKEIFRAYDIRGIVAKDFFPKDAYQIGLAIGKELQQQNNQQIITARDGRLSSPEISTNLNQGLIDSGCTVVDIGIVATPLLYFALEHMLIPSGVMVTASHNPANYNGIKMVFDKLPVSAEKIQELYQAIISNKLEKSQKGAISRSTVNVIEAYKQAVVDNVTLKKSFNIAIDCGNGASSLLVCDLFEQLGCHVQAIYCDLDGSFPNHSPDPTQPSNLAALQQIVVDKKLDMGIAFDGDADRLIAIDGNGKILWPDRIMAILAEDILSEHPDRKVVFDVKCTNQLPLAIKKAGGEPSICASGHSFLKTQMRQVDAVMGGEFSGHIVLRDRWSDFDDAIYNSARLLETLSKQSISPTEVFAQIPECFCTPEHHLLFDNTEASKQAFEKIQASASFENAELTEIDGLRVEYTDRWGLVRVSHTTPSLSFRFEAINSEKLEAIMSEFRQLLFSAGIDKKLPF